MQISAPNPKGVIQRSGLNFASTKGIQFNSGSLLSVYSVASWTPVDQSGGGLTFTSVNCSSTIIGNMCFVYGSLNYPATADVNNASISGVPVTVPGNTYALGKFFSGINGTDITVLQFINSLPRFGFYHSSTGNPCTNVQLSGSTQRFMSQVSVT